MALPNNRRIFDMAAQAWKQSKTILSGPLESPLNPYERLKSLAIQVDGRHYVGFDLGRLGGDFSCIVQWDRQRVQAVDVTPTPTEAEFQCLIAEISRQIDARINRIIDGSEYHVMFDTTASSVSCPPVSPPPVPNFDAQAGQLAGPPAQVHGHYLCEFCFDQMTDQLLPAAQSATGMAMAWCGCERGEDMVS